MCQVTHHHGLSSLHESATNRDVIEVIGGPDGEGYCEEALAKVTAADAAFIEAADPQTVLALLDDYDEVNEHLFSAREEADALALRVTELEAAIAKHRDSGIDCLCDDAAGCDACRPIYELWSVLEGTGD